MWDILSKTLIQAVMLPKLPQVCDDIVNSNLTEDYDIKMQTETAIVILVISVAKNYGNTIFDIEKICDILHFTNKTGIINIEGVKPVSVNELSDKFAALKDLDYDKRYGFISAILCCFEKNNIAPKKCDDIIKIAAFLNIKKNDFIYLIRKYR